MASQAPMASATAGTSQTNGNVRPDFGAASAVGICSGGGASLMFFFYRIPDQPGIEALRREHRQHHYGAEGDRRWPGMHARERGELHDGREQGDDIDVEHRPAPDRL